MRGFVWWKLVEAEDYKLKSKKTYQVILRIINFLLFIEGNIKSKQRRFYSNF